MSTDGGRGTVDTRIDQLVHGLFEDRVRSCPGRVAVVAGGVAVSYGELNGSANRLARHLRGLGVGPGVIVAVSLRRDVRLVVALLAVFKAGGVYLPLDPDYPRPRLEFMLDNAGAAVLVTSTDVGWVGAADGGHGPGGGGFTGQVVVFDDDAGGHRADGDGDVGDADDGADGDVGGGLPWRDLPGEDLGVVAGPGDLAYVIFTSGSTGRPKGVLIEHHNLTNYLTVGSGETGLTPHDVVAPLVSVSFDPSIREVLSPLLAGARLILLPSDTTRDPALLSKTLLSHRVTALLGLVPSLLRAILDFAEEDGITFDGLRLVATAGEPLRWDLVRRLHKLAPGVLVVNQYGPTECTMVSTRMVAGTTDEQQVGIVPIGRAVANARLLVVDESGNLVPDGVVGELWIGGAGVGRGYLNQPELTAQKFVTDPLGSGERFYRSGDLVRWLPEGTLQFVGRADHQVKIRGFRVELGEIEANLAAHPQVADAVVLADAGTDSADGTGAGSAQRLLAYVVPAAPAPVTGGDAAVSPEELRLFLSDRLPAYMVPSAFVLLDRLPLTPNGKIDRVALPKPSSDRAALGEPFVAPRTDLERRVAAVWSHVLGVDAIGVHDNFFELGGHSLTAAQVVALLTADHPQCTLRTLLQHQTLADLAHQLERTT